MKPELQRLFDAEERASVESYRTGSRPDVEANSIRVCQRLMAVQYARAGIAETKERLHTLIRQGWLTDHVFRRAFRQAARDFRLLAQGFAYMPPERP